MVWYFILIFFLYEIDSYTSLRPTWCEVVTVAYRTSLPSGSTGGIVEELANPNI